MLATRWVHPLIRHKIRNHSLTKRSYGLFHEYDPIDWYAKWLVGHTAGGALIGAISVPLMYSHDEYEKALRSGTPARQINMGEIFLCSLPMTTIGMVAGAICGATVGLPGPLSYMVAGGYWWYHRKLK